MTSKTRIDKIKTPYFTIRYSLNTMLIATEITSVTVRSYRSKKAGLFV